MNSLEINPGGHASRQWQTVPVCFALPAIVGNLTRGVQQGAYVGQWTNSPTGYQVTWLVDDVAQAFGLNFTPSAVDVGKMLKISVVASNGYPSEPALSIGAKIL